MEKLNQIPAEIRWDIATRCADKLPFAYENAIYKIAADKAEQFEQAEREIWNEFGKKQGILAKELGCKTNNAEQVANTISALSSAIFGPQLEGEVRAGGGDSATVITTSCPFKENSQKYSQDPKNACRMCSEYWAGAADSLNSDYEVSFSKHMCVGDNFCETTIGKR
ncbi:hypothetical protein F1737_10090 [Methanoplanus sp. FWC-SCC4]|uniref:L-2-amino-thiazoline-4-carboxylic acid hydrolase n=1 Tax=Methanochimaera problematica TaxID=2609417 RepID=A0AA97FDE3_9EURY|nr:hypothetical protein [Methanoplanus sp. FWC-SCC4]WOF17002.1 hypothetical protein F1737_10090 [Methanoplanus sp. FWC-SCC4]